MVHRFFIHSCLATLAACGVQTRSQTESSSSGTSGGQTGTSQTSSGTGTTTSGSSTGGTGTGCSLPDAGTPDGGWPFGTCPCGTIEGYDLIENSQGCQPGCAGDADCPDPGTSCQGGACLHTICSRMMYRAVSSCAVTSPGDGTCLPFYAPDMGENLGVCVLGGTSTTACSNEATRATLNEQCVVGSVCVERDAGVWGCAPICAAGGSLDPSQGQPICVDAGGSTCVTNSASTYPQPYVSYQLLPVCR